MTGSATPTFAVKADVDDKAPGYLVNKIDGITIVLNSNDKLVANGGSSPTYTVKADVDDALPGYLSEKIDNTTITLNNSNQLVAGPRPMLVKTADFDLDATCLNQTVKVDSQTDITATLVAANSVPSGSWIRVINTNPVLLTISGSIGDRNNPKLNVNNTATFMSTGGSWRWTDNTNLPANPTVRLTVTQRLSISHLNRTIVLDSTVGSSLTLPPASSVPDGSWFEFVNICTYPWKILGEVDAETEINLWRFSSTKIVSSNNWWYSV